MPGCPAWVVVKQGVGSSHTLHLVVIREVDDVAVTLACHITCQWLVLEKPLRFNRLCQRVDMRVIGLVFLADVEALQHFELINRHLP